MKIGLIDVDGSSFPNLALMKISASHKEEGDTVEWYTPFEHYDRVYVAKVFSFSEDWNEPINADDVIYGGTGYQIEYINGKEKLKVLTIKSRQFGLDNLIQAEIKREMIKICSSKRYEKVHKNLRVR